LFLWPGFLRILILPSVSGSFKNTSKQSMKFVPLKGSPPIPEIRKAMDYSLSITEMK